MGRQLRRQIVGPRRDRGRPDAAWRRAPTAPATVKQEQMDVAAGGKRTQHVKMACGQPRQAKQREARRQLDEPRAVAKPCARRPESLGGPGLRRSGSQASPQLRLPSRAGGQRPAVAIGVVAQAHAADLGSVQRVAVEEFGEMADGAEAARADAPGSDRSAVPPNARTARAATARRENRRRPPAAARRHAPGSHGSSSGAIPEAAAPSRRPAGAGTGRRRSHTSRPHARATCRGQPDRRCVSQRSIPRVGTAITSAANGSGYGSTAAHGARRSGRRPDLLDGRVTPFRRVGETTRRRGRPPNLAGTWTWRERS